MSKQREPFASPGEVVTCENGHEICVIAKPLISGQIMSVDLFQDWKIEVPQANAIVEPCPCGAEYIRGGRATDIHIGGEWRP